MFRGGRGGEGRGGALECDMTERCPFFKDLHKLFKKKIAFQYPVSKFLDYKTVEKQ